VPEPTEPSSFPPCQGAPAVRHPSSPILGWHASFKNSPPTQSPTTDKPIFSQALRVPSAVYGTRRGCEKMGLAPSRNGENPGKSAVAKVPVPIFSQPRSVPTTLELNNIFLRSWFVAAGSRFYWSFWTSSSAWRDACWLFSMVSGSPVRNPSAINSQLFARWSAYSTSWRSIA
jgi:hypothetical protein